jgi:Ca-activated chloride channel homolog
MQMSKPSCLNPLSYGERSNTVRLKIGRKGILLLPPWRGKGARQTVPPPPTQSRGTGLTALRRRSRAKVGMGGRVEGEGMCCRPYSSLLLFLVLLYLPVPGQAASPYQAVQQGNALYQSGKYAEAAEQYGSASQMVPDAAEIHFNQGNAAYKQQDYRKAHEHYTQALQTAERTLEGKVKYNLGNVEYQQALQNLQQPQAAMPHLRSAMTYYRDSLDVDPQQPDTRYNLELSHLLLHKLQQEQQRPPQQQKQQQDAQQQDGQQQAQQDGQQQQQSQQQQGAQPQAQAPDQQPGQPPQAASPEQADQQAAQPQDTSQDNVPPPGQQTAAQQELRPEDAARLLEAIRERGREVDNQRQQRRAKTRATQVDKDW